MGSPLIEPSRSTRRQQPLVPEHALLPAAVASGLGNRLLFVHGVYRNDARCSEHPGEIRISLHLAASRYMPTGFRFRRGNPWGFKSLLEHNVEIARESVGALT